MSIMLEITTNVAVARPRFFGPAAAWSSVGAKLSDTLRTFLVPATLNERRRL
jgi:hypothetical protein